MTDPFEEPAYVPEESRFANFRASLTTPGKVANEPLTEPAPGIDHRRTWSEEPIGAAAHPGPRSERRSLLDRIRRTGGTDDAAERSSDPLALDSSGLGSPGSSTTADTEADATSSEGGDSHGEAHPRPLTVSDGHCEPLDNQLPTGAANSGSGAAAATDTSPFPASAPSPSSNGGGWSIFKSKEEKALLAVADEEEVGRRAIKDEQKALRKAAEKEYKAGDEKVRDMVKKHAKVLGAAESEEKSARDGVTKEYKKELEAHEKTFRKEGKKLR